MICLKIIYIVIPSGLAKALYKTKNKKKNNKLVEEIKNRWSNLNDEIKKMSEDEKKWRTR